MVDGKDEASAEDGATTHFYSLETQVTQRQAYIGLGYRSKNSISLGGPHVPIMGLSVKLDNKYGLL
jgi:hypothetical protein